MFRSKLTIQFLKTKTQESNIKYNKKKKRKSCVSITKKAKRNYYENVDLKDIN